MTLAAAGCGTGRATPPASSPATEADTPADTSAVRTGDPGAHADSTQQAVAARGDVGRLADAAATALTWTFVGIAIVAGALVLVMRGNSQ